MALSARALADLAALGAVSRRVGPSRRVDGRGGGGPACTDARPPKAFLDHLRLIANASAHTVRAYESDLDAVPRVLAARAGRRTIDLTAADLDHTGARAFLAELHARGPVARDRGAQARGGPAVRPLPAARGDHRRRSRRRSSARRSARQRMPAHLSEHRDDAAPRRSPTRPRRSDAATGRFSSCSMRPACGSASSSASISTT